MVQPTSPDNINKWTNSDPTSIAQASQSQGDSVQAALNKRQRYGFVWPTATERTAQTGMVQGSLGYQRDTDVNYFYDGAQWTPSVVRFFGTQLTAVANTAGNKISYTVVEDTASGYSSGDYTVRYSGVYLASASSKQGSSATSVTLSFWKNGVLYAVAPAGQTASFTGSSLIMYLPLVVGDIISVRPVTNNFTAHVETPPAHNNYFQLIRIF